MKGKQLTDAILRKKNPLDKAYDVKADYPGLTCRINPKGKKTWYVQYRIKGVSYPLRKRLGNYPTIGVKEAELRAKKISNDLFLGKDPREQEKIDIGNMFLKDGLNQFYETDFNTKSPYYSKSTVQGFMAIMKVWVFRKTNDADILQRYLTIKDIGSVKLNKITNKMVEDIHREVSKRSPYVANRLVQYLRLFWNTFVKLPNNPFILETKKLNTEKEYLDFLTPIEMQRVMSNAFRVDGNTGRLLMSHYIKNDLNPVSCCGIALMLATGRRTDSEVLSVQWHNFKSGFKPSLVYEKTKTSKKNKKFSFRLGKKALEIIQTIQRDKFNNPESVFFYPINDVRNNQIFPSKDFGRKLANKKKGSTPYVKKIYKTWQKLLKMSGIDRHLKLYSTRHSFASNYYLKTKDVKGGADALGTTVNTFNKYAKVLQDQVVEGIDSIEFDKTETKLKQVK